MITYFLFSILLWFAYLIDTLLYSVGFLRTGTLYFNSLLTYIDLLVLLVRPLFPLTVTLIFSTLFNWFMIFFIFLFLGLVKRFIPWFGSTKTFD
jgi:hypothetical protein